MSRSARQVLIVSFGVLLGLLVATGWDAIRILNEIHADEQAARLDFLSRTAPIYRIRSELTLYGDLLQSDPAKQEVGQLCSRMRSELMDYPRTRKPDEQILIDHLLTMLADQDRVRARLLAAPDTSHVQILVGTEALPTHLRVIAATERIALWNDSQFRSANAALIADFQQVRDRLKRLLFILLGSGLAISMGSIILIAAQEKEIRKRYAELERNHAAQAQLSARLLDAQEQERLSISRELHDEVGQSLGALLVDMGRLSGIVAANDNAAQEQIHKIRLLAEASVASVRNIALLLRPSMLDDLGLVAAVEWQAREISRRSAVEVEVQASDLNVELKEDVKICIYRITQEALNNVARHSGARHARVTLNAGGGQIAVTIRDDGRGFDPKRSRGLGLLGMEERVRLLRGAFRVDSAPGSGTEIAATLPLSPA